MRSKILLQSRLVFLPVLLIGVPKVSLGGSASAFHTATSTGASTNSNQYESKCSVYLAGGSGLENGDYYFQVTDPSGGTLLSADAVSNRRFRVAGGVISAFAGTGGPVHPTGLDQNHQGAVTISLASASCPTDFATSLNSGDVYKVWVTPVDSFSGNAAKVDSPCKGGCSHGFLHSKSKTDNFKVQPGSSATFCLTAQQLFTKDGTSSFLNTLGGWGFTVMDPGGTQLGGITTTGANGSTATLCQLSPGTYSVTEAEAGPIPIGCGSMPADGVSTPQVFENSTPLKTGSAKVTFTWDSSQPANITVSFVNQLACFF